jgi:hypothetical protein
MDPLNTTLQRIKGLEDGIAEACKSSSVFCEIPLEGAIHSALTYGPGSSTARLGAARVIGSDLYAAWRYAQDSYLHQDAE